MSVLFLLACIIVLAVPSSSQRHRNGEQNSPPLMYESSYTKETEFLPISRVRQTEYDYKPHQTYTPEIQYQPSYLATTRATTKARVNQSKQQSIHQPVEQYLKEVTPTTKTIYEPISLQYTRSSVAKQPHFEKYQEQSHFLRQNIEPSQSSKQSSTTQSGFSYHNIPLARQYALYEKQQPQGDSEQQNNEKPISAIFVSQTVPKKITAKATKSKVSTLNEELKYLRKVQYPQLQQQTKELRIPDYSKLDLLSIEEKHGQFQVESRSPVSSPLDKPTKLPRIQNYQPQHSQPQGIKYQPDITYQSEQDIELKYKPISNFQYEQPQLDQYQSQEDSYRSEHSPEYYQTEHQSQSLPSKQETPVYQGPTEEEYRQSQVKQRLGKNSNLRILKTGKPVVFIGHDE